MIIWSPYLTKVLGRYFALFQTVCFQTIGQIVLKLVPINGWRSESTLNILVAPKRPHRPKYSNITLEIIGQILIIRAEIFQSVGAIMSKPSYVCPHTPVKFDMNIGLKVT